MATRRGDVAGARGVGEWECIDESSEADDDEEEEEEVISAETDANSEKILEKEKEKAEELNGGRTFLSAPKNETVFDGKLRVKRRLQNMLGFVFGGYEFVECAKNEIRRDEQVLL